MHLFCKKFDILHKTLQLCNLILIICLIQCYKEQSLTCTWWQKQIPNSRFWWRSRQELDEQTVLKSRLPVISLKIVPLPHYTKKSFKNAAFGFFVCLLSHFNTYGYFESKKYLEKASPFLQCRAVSTNDLEAALLPISHWGGLQMACLKDGVPE